MNTIRPETTSRKSGVSGTNVDTIHNRSPLLDPDDIRTWPREWLKFLTVAEIKALTGLSEDTIRRTYPRLLKRLAARRVGARLGDVILNIGATTSTTEGSTV
jgi:hypothetical protein